MYKIVYSIEEDEHLYEKWVFSFSKQVIAKACEDLEYECKLTGKTLRSIIEIKPFGVF